jgi:hypothetical protein
MPARWPTVTSAAKTARPSTWLATIRSILRWKTERSRGPRPWAKPCTGSALAPNTLSACLKMLEQAGIVERAFYARHPPRADDRLTEKGEKMRGILGAMRRWGLDHG